VTRPLSVLFLALRAPCSPTRGDTYRAYHQLAELRRRGHRVALFAFLDDEDAEEARAHLTRLADHVELVRKSKTGSRLAAVASIASNKPLQLAYWSSPEMHLRVRRWLRRSDCDVAHAQFFRMAQYVPRSLRAAKVVDLGDSMGMNLRRRAELEQPPRSWLVRIEAERAGRYEAAVLDDFDAGLVIAEPDRAAILARRNGFTLDIVPNGVDLVHFAPDQAHPEPRTILFTGTMSYFPNADAAIWFCHEVLPKIRKRCPDARFVIAGRAPTREVRDLAGPGVDVTGAVEDIRPYFRRAAVFVCPMRSGSGSQVKNLEAMAMGLPVVTTTVGASGLEVEPGRDLLVGDSVEAFSEHVVNVLTNRELAGRLRESGRAAMEERYLWSRVGDRLEAIYRRVVAS
jgi:polysaccharide biosynthesis protein PslH